MMHPQTNLQFWIEKKNIFIERKRQTVRPKLRKTKSSKVNKKGLKFCKNKVTKTARKMMLELVRVELVDPRNSHKR